MAINPKLVKLAHDKLVYDLCSADPVGVKSAIDELDVTEFNQNNVPLRNALYRANYYRRCYNYNKLYRNENGNDLRLANQWDEIVRLLKAKGAVDGNADIKEALDPKLIQKAQSNALFSNDVEAVKYAILSGANLEVVKPYCGYNMCNHTPLQWAAHCGRAEIVELLVKAGADINKKDFNGDAPIDLAWRFSGPEYDKIVDILKKAGAKLKEYREKESDQKLVDKLKEALDPKLIQKAQSDALFSNDVEAVKSAILSGANLEVTALRVVRTKIWRGGILRNHTPLQWAALCGRVDIAELLIKAGADINKKTFDGVSAMDILAKLKREKESDQKRSFR